MAKEAMVAREGGVTGLSSRNAVSQRTKRYDSDVQRAIYKRAADLERRYSGSTGLYQTREMMSSTEQRNQRRIRKAAKNMALRTIR